MVLVLMAISMIIVSLLMIIPVVGIESVAIWVLMEVVMVPIPESCM